MCLPRACQIEQVTYLRIKAGGQGYFPLVYAHYQRPRPMALAGIMIIERLEIRLLHNLVKTKPLTSLKLDMLPELHILHPLQFNASQLILYMSPLAFSIWNASWEHCSIAFNWHARHAHCYVYFLRYLMRTHHVHTWLCCAFFEEFLCLVLVVNIIANVHSMGILWAMLRRSWNIGAILYLIGSLCKYCSRRVNQILLHPAYDHPYTSKTYVYWNEMLINWVDSQTQNPMRVLRTLFK